ncbi:MAG TPA: hypothetical protein VNN80_28825 [Polyangiaceae bacterium]|jgi:hypothetical protein|nr:hypothetical protein [Polyangiaceae bacterium]
MNRPRTSRSRLELAGSALVLLLLLLGAPATGCGGSQAAPEPPPGPTIQSRAREEARALARALESFARDPARVPSASPLAAGLRQANTDLLWLEQRAGGWQASPSLEAFVAGIADHRRLLAEASALPADELASLLDAVVRDVSVKARQCRTFGGPVPVSIRVITRDATNREVNGYEVWFVRKAYESKPAAFRRFEQNSSPAGHVFNEAGYYVLWTDHLSARALKLRAQPIDVEVGPDRRDQLVDLTVPGEAAAADAASIGAP